MFFGHLRSVTQLQRSYVVVLVSPLDEAYGSFLPAPCNVFVPILSITLPVPGWLDIAEAKDLATEWTEQQPPWDVQSVTTEKKGQQCPKEFAKEMWKWCGAMVVVMVAWEDVNGEVIIGVHDFNDELSHGKLFQGLEDCRDKFVKYARTAFGSGGTDDESVDNDATPQLQQQKKPAKDEVNLLLSKDGTPNIPNILDMQVLRLKDIMHTFVTLHYRKVCSNSEATVPWSAIATNMNIYIAPKFLPPDVPFKEPTQLTQGELTAILEWWQEWKMQHPDNIFAFKRWRDSSAKDIPDPAGGWHGKQLAN
ncbi:hypothetical protein F5J12DRAFT_894116 [Pisolithus orientalis]|uniref:uncharacterized protein n=1 Tax=Pisolithus orientalis TaxID=936130 RepID=UPI0022254839|nr:uncharacterized protein F5J12DRAFT_894116 [Pisolithus orientalis]KAI6002360.1 hypothetical protein F5J12DRAFT_894116 [Pisolithus orientalis]